MASGYYVSTIRNLRQSSSKTPISSPNSVMIHTPQRVQFVVGVKQALPARRDIFFRLAKLCELLPGATRMASDVGINQLEVASAALEVEGHCCAGLNSYPPVGTRWRRRTRRWCSTSQNWRHGMVARSQA